MTLKQWSRTPKSYVAMTMFSYLLIASILSQNVMGVVNGVIAVLVSVLVDVLLCVLEKRKRIMPDGAVITGLIIALILGTTSSWIIVTSTAVIAILSKHLLVYKKKALFNPAAFGLFLSILIFHAQQNWWGAFADLPAWTIVMLLIGGYVVTNRVNKYPQVFSFLATAFSLLFLMGYFHFGDAASALRPPFINATLFFGFFMLTDPPTSPAKRNDQIAFGILSAVTGTIVYALFGGLMYLFIGLFIGNLYHLLKRKKPKRLANTQTRMGRRNRSLWTRLNS